MSRYKAYPAYKDSGLQWLGHIPTHWELMQSRRLFAQRKERARQGDEQLTASQKYGVIYQKLFMELEGQSVVQVFTGADILKHVEENDFVISMRSFQGGLELCRYPGCVSSAYVGLIPIKHVRPEFFKYLFKCSPYIQALQSTSNLVRDGQALRFENFSQVHLPCIPDDEQKKIATFLDRETAKIDALIEKQQRLIELLKEKRQAVISHAVTKGLNPNAPMKDSGVEWLGEVPEYWDIKRISYVSQLRSGDAIVSDQIEAEGDYPVYGGNGLRGYCPNFNLDGNFILIGRQGALCGNINYGSGRFWASEHAVVVYPSLDLDVKWFGETLRAMNLNQYNVSAAQPGLAVANIVCLKIPFPPKKEQELIAAFLDHKTAKIDTLIEKQQRLIELAKERRTALISAAITGKIDVRDWQPAAAQAVVGVAC